MDVADAGSFLARPGRRRGASPGGRPRPKDQRYCTSAHCRGIAHPTLVEKTRRKPVRVRGRGPERKAGCTGGSRAIVTTGETSACGFVAKLPETARWRSWVAAYLLQIAIAPSLATKPPLVEAAAGSEGVLCHFEC
jgi:hypothetical protein